MALTMPSTRGSISHYSIITAPRAPYLPAEIASDHEGLYPWATWAYGRVPYRPLSLLEEVSRWRRKKGELEALAKEWETVLHREVKWKMAYDRTLSLNELRYGVALIQDTDWERRIRSALPASARELVLRVDMATQDPRPENPFAMGKTNFTS
jgi:hypothetical protein